MSKTPEQMIDKMASKIVPMAKKLGGDKKQKNVADKFAAKKEESRK